ncbi:hypothetical protein VMCG_00761 [Cytospora schulzeri]|uniref:Uncharacterized protein n=1 Tax=Cytospora schulzeri TaxID=448051 RepID=A0A423X8C7_9PEZI|nr:hypothetical protein VMCG_00761 [Valsa malicola]
MALAFRSTSLPLSIIVKGFREKIDQLRISIPQNIMDHTAIKSQIHIAEILLYEVGIHEELSATLPLAERLGLLWECLKATRSMLEARFEKPRSERPRQINLSTFDYAYAMLTCLKLSILNVPGWDLRVVRKELDCDEFLGKQIQDIKDFVAQRKRAFKGDGGGGTDEQLGHIDQFERLHKKLSAIRVSLRAELAATIPPEGPGETTQAGPTDQGTESTAGPVTDVAAPLELFPEDLMQNHDGSFGQDICRVGEWEMDFYSFLGWGAGDTSEPAYTSWMCADNP